jgi:hypothetical protein
METGACGPPTGPSGSHAHARNHPRPGEQQIREVITTESVAAESSPQLLGEDSSAGILGACGQGRPKHIPA